MTQRTYQFLKGEKKDSRVYPRSIMSAVTKNCFAGIDENKTLSNVSCISIGLSSVQVLEVFGLIVVIVVSVILNGLVCSVVCRTKSLRKLTTSIFIVNLAISNALVALCIIPFSVQAVIEKAWKHSNIFCQVSFLKLFIVFFVSLVV